MPWRFAPSAVAHAAARAVAPAAAAPSCVLVRYLVTSSSSAHLSIEPISADWALGSDQYVPSAPNITPASPNGHIRSLARPPGIRSAASAAPSLARKSQLCRHHRPPCPTIRLPLRP